MKAAHWGKSPFYPKIIIFKITFFHKNHISEAHLSQKSHFQNRIFNKNHISEAHLEQKSHFQISIFHKKKSQFKISYFAKILFSKSHNSKKSQYFKYKIQVNLWRKSVNLPQCEP